MMALWKIRLSYGAKKEVGDVRIENGIIQGDAFSPLLFVLMIYPIVKTMKLRVSDGEGIFYHMDDLKASMTIIQMAQTIHETVKEYTLSVGMVIKSKKSTIQLSVETPLPESLHDIPWMDDMTYKYIVFEMKRRDVDKKMKEVMKVLEGRIKEKLEGPQGESTSSR